MNTECSEENLPSDSVETLPKRRLRTRPSKTSKVAPENNLPGPSFEPTTSHSCIDQAALICNKQRTAFKRTKTSKNVTILPRTCNAHSYDAMWEERDRQRLLNALQRFGMLNMKELLNAVPGKTEEEIKTFIQAKWRAARSHLREELKKKNKKEPHLGPIDKWLQSLHEKFPGLDVYKANPLARAVLFIWKFEKHPDPKACGGVDFRAAYEYLYYMLRGFPPRQLNQPTATFVSESLSELAHLIRHQPWVEEKNYVRNKPLKIKCLPKKIKSDDDVVAALSFTQDKCLEELVKLPGFNPFNIPLHYLNRKGPVPSSSDLPSSSTNLEESITSAQSND